jgi:hypothetical protein
MAKFKRKLPIYRERKSYRIKRAEVELRKELPLHADRDRLVKIQIAVNQDKAVIRIGVSVML